MGRTTICYEGTTANSGKYVEIGALHWLDAPLPILRDQKIVGTASNIEREDGGGITAEVSMDLSDFDINAVVTNVIEHETESYCVIDHGRIRELHIVPSDGLGTTFERGPQWTAQLRRFARRLMASRKRRSSENFESFSRTPTSSKLRQFGWTAISEAILLQLSGVLVVGSLVRARTCLS